MTKPNRQWLRVAALLACLVASGCATLVESLTAPQIRLLGIQLLDSSLTKQTFALELGVTNDNPIPLPIAGLDYALKLNGSEFVAGESDQRFTVPANGDTSFKLTISTDLISVARQLRGLLTSTTTEIDYDLSGAVALDIPATPPLAFQHDGSVAVSR